MTRTWRVPLHLAPLQNELLRMHWTKAKRIKASAGLALLAQHGKGKANGAGVQRVTVTRRSTREPDADSGFGAKLVLDTLVRLGWFRDDSPASIELVCRWEKAKRGGGELVVEVAS